MSEICYDRCLQLSEAALELAYTKGPLEAQRIKAEQRLGNAVDRTVVLALLERLTVHSHGVETDFWDLDSFHYLFSHLTLRYLYISRVSLIEDILVLSAHTSKTPLTSTRTRRVRD
ncbi:hypothetical protein SNOG_11930 [Parastagonospora nodorum SN15]|uniref:Uncharacterized protein n=1 Tax=Phaeosphaeria nodorum (strain SN15 / ATCC MYA-4574 / FGSC 10173) TaxID=321614 RepID=Q0U8I4_PHANO|nr:hypothetical protein SNOG_11930 [Parastagonospora nodorum SN15]EAT80974.1 hypothetical protein SNOG_11930 [Parastagonospora nodorum SN15]